MPFDGSDREDNQRAFDQARRSKRGGALWHSVRENASLRWGRSGGLGGAPDRETSGTDLDRSGQIYFLIPAANKYFWHGLFRQGSRFLNQE
jgi:hypothetical protein